MTGMNQSQGYKNTEIGLVPNNWDIVTIGSLITEFRGGASLKPSDFTNSGVKVLPKRGVGRTGWLHIDNDDLKYCSHEYASINYRSQVDEKYTIVVLRDLVPSGPSIGLIVQIKEKETYVLAQGVYGFKVTDTVLPEYLVQLSHTNWYRKLMNSIMVGSTQVHIRNTTFKQVRIPLPTLAEQHAIASALSDVDALITSLDALIAKKRLIKQAAMQELLTGKIRLPGFNRKWETKKMGEVGFFFKGKGLPKENLMDSGKTPAIPYTAIYTDFDEIVSRKNIYNYTQVSDTIFIDGPHVLIAGSSNMLENIGKTCAYYDDKEVAIGGDVIIFKTDYDVRFISYLLNTKPNRKKIVSLSQGSTIRHVYISTFLDYELDFPLVEEQQSIANILYDMEAEITALEQRRDKTRLLKQGMLQELLTGRIRLV